MAIVDRLVRRLHNIGLKARTSRVRREGLTYLSLDKLRRLEAALAQIERRRVPGALLEFGVALGGSAILIAGHAGPSRVFHGFDVFAMIPPPTSQKDDDKSRERYAVIASGASEGIDGSEYYGYRENLFDEVRASFARHGHPVDGRKIVLHRGLFEDTVPQAAIGQIAFAHIDCDWFDPVAYCLETVANGLAPGGLVLIDDYHDYGGARLAVDEFLVRRPDFVMDDGPNPILLRG